MNLKKLERTIDYHFKNQNYLIHALTHPSYSNENEGINFNNQTLEFLGDSVVGFIVSCRLFIADPHLAEGELTKIKSEIVKKESLADVARKINLGKYLFLGKGERTEKGEEKTSILADAFEALIGAIYIDGGIKNAGRVIDRVMGDLIDRIIKTPSFTDYKTKLQETIQKKFKTIPKYKIIDEIGPPHEKTFVVSLTILNKIKTTGMGGSKKDAEQDAAKRALELIETT